MLNANIVVMGKTGTGKSTLVNAVMGYEAAETGKGRAVTQKNEVYSRSILLPKNPGGQNSGMVGRKINLYDTVGLEIDKNVTSKVLNDLKCLIQKAQNDSGENDINLVWFCINSESKRFEPYEMDLIRMLSIEYEIPFIIVMTQCLEEKNTFERQIEIDMPEIALMRVLAKDYKLRTGVIPAFGVQELVRRSVFEHHSFKIRVLENKLQKLTVLHGERISTMIVEAESCIEKHAKYARNAGFLPGACVPVVHGFLVKMIIELHGIFGIHTVSGFGPDIIAYSVISLVVTPLMCIPVFSAVTAYAYVQTAGEQYLETLENVVEKSTDEELKNAEIVSERIRKELSSKKQSR